MSYGNFEWFLFNQFPTNKQTIAVDFLKKKNNTTAVFPCFRWWSTVPLRISGPRTAEEDTSQGLVNSQRACPAKKHWLGDYDFPFLEGYTVEDWRLEPTNHPFRKEIDLPNLHDYVPCQSSMVYTPFKAQNIAKTRARQQKKGDSGRLWPLFFYNEYVPGKFV